jgi:hypothetical protein
LNKELSSKSNREKERKDPLSQKTKLSFPNFLFPKPVDSDEELLLEILFHLKNPLAHQRSNRRKWTWALQIFTKRSPHFLRKINQEQNRDASNGETPN